MQQVLLSSAGLTFKLRQAPLYLKAAFQAPANAAAWSQNRRGHYCFSTLLLNRQVIRMAASGMNSSGSEPHGSTVNLSTAALAPVLEDPYKYGIKPAAPGALMTAAAVNLGAPCTL